MSDILLLDSKMAAASRAFFAFLFYAQKHLALCVIICTIRTNKIEREQRREKLWTLFARGMKRHDIAKELGVDATTISRDTAYLIEQSHNNLNGLAKETLPFMYQISIEGINDVIRECHTIYQSNDSRINMCVAISYVFISLVSKVHSFCLLSFMANALVLLISIYCI